MRYFAVLFACFSLLAQAPARRADAPAPNGVIGAIIGEIPTPSVKPEDKCAIEGTVVNAVTGEALKKARLSLRPLGGPNGVPYGANTDGAGHFLIDSVDPGRYSFSASRNGFVSQQYSPTGSTRQGTTLTLTNGQKIKDLTFKLTPQGVIGGRILDEDGDPMANVMVQVMVFGYQRGKKQLMNRNGVSTDDRGEFRIHGLGPGKYILSATYQSPDIFTAMAVRPPQAQPESEEGYTTTFYPNTTNAENATQLNITPGAQITGLNMTLARVRTVRVKGHVNGSFPNAGRRNAMVMLLPRDNTGFMPRAMVRVLDAQGNFELRGVAPGSYMLRADYNNDNMRFSGRLQLDVGNSNIEGIELSLSPPGELKGKLVVEENGDLAGTRLNVLLQPKQNGAMMGNSRAQVQDDLNFQMNNVGPDPYDIVVTNLPEGFYLKSVRLGQQDVTETGVDFSQGVSAGELVVTINPHGGQIDGTAQNDKGEAAASATVTLIPDEAHRELNWLYKTANTDQNGHFTMKGLRPGKYTIYAWEDIEQGAYQDADFVKPHESSGEKVTIEQSAHSTVQLKVVPAEKSGNEKAVR
ncbi:MAG TPA: carboxypeptidase regulatory-like domain-containing protein [Bryobacteraceae bacterium]|nr:carboxypeptidase regulatory-like domain-containing protein [Bryobacteraceae bacterium]